MSGRRIRILDLGLPGPGMHQVVWDGLDESGREAAPGIYFLLLETGGEDRVRRVVILR